MTNVNLLLQKCSENTTTSIALVIHPIGENVERNEIIVDAVAERNTTDWNSRGCNSPEGDLKIRLNVWG